MYCRVESSSSSSSACVRRERYFSCLLKDYFKCLQPFWWNDHWPSEEERRRWPLASASVVWIGRPWESKYLSHRMASRRARLEAAQQSMINVRRIVVVSFSYWNEMDDLKWELLAESIKRELSPLLVVRVTVSVCVYTIRRNGISFCF